MPQYWELSHERKWEGREERWKSDRGAVVTSACFGAISSYVAVTCCVTSGRLLFNL